MHLLRKLRFLLLLSVDVLATKAHPFSRTRSCKGQISKTAFASKPVGAALLQASTAGSHSASLSVNVKRDTITQDDSNVWSAEMHDFGDSSRNLRADLYTSQQRSKLSHSAMATADLEALLEQGEQMGENSFGTVNSLPNLSSVTDALPSVPSTQDIETAAANAPKQVEDAVIAAPKTIQSLASNVYRHQWTFLDAYLFTMILIACCVLPCLVPLLRLIKVKTWRQAWLYKILPVMLILALIPLQLVVFEKLGFLWKMVELAEPLVVIVVIAATVLLPLLFMFYEIAKQRLRPTLQRLAQMEQRLEAITGVDFDGDGVVASFWDIPEFSPLWKTTGSARDEGQTQAGSVSDGEGQAPKGKQPLRKPSRSSSQPPKTSAKKGCLAC
eukprot:TRINITY_DN77363_c0_g1_i1.p1 TRINITY_DN77363_c0_g1~~TRINITY_DN77363_c0_g1_i1.p1  ORF type:complete len:385 (+),score=78.08 TRINITY_DN77363_c0_g1_i1:89-1243(+)